MIYLAKLLVKLYMWFVGNPICVKHWRLKNSYISYAGWFYYCEECDAEPEINKTELRRRRFKLNGVLNP